MVVVLLIIAFWVGYAWRGRIEHSKLTSLRLQPPAAEFTKLLVDVKEVEVKAKELIEAIGILFMLAARQSASLRARRSVQTVAPTERQ
jgi:hypothetical protein